MDTDHYKRVVETALICAQEPLTTNELNRLFVEPPLASADLQKILFEIQKEWHDKGMELVNIRSAPATQNASRSKRVRS